MMLNELSRMVKGWLADPDTDFSVAAMLDKVQVIDGDTRPRPPAAIYCDAEDDCVSERINPTMSPSLVVLTEGDALADIHRIQKQYDSKRVGLGVLYCVNDIASVAQARQDAGYVMSAVVDSLWALQEPSKSRGRKFFNDCELIAWMDVAITRASLREDKVMVIAAVLAAAHMRRVVRP